MIILAIPCGMAQNSRMAIQSGVLLEVRTASGERVPMRALGSPKRGRDFPVVWVCTEQEYQRAQSAHDEADGIPWPLDAVTEMEPA
jgi:hypothetical protein